MLQEETPSVEAGTPAALVVTAAAGKLTSAWRFDFALVGFAIVVGLACRYALLDHVTADTFMYLLPWYEYAREHGFEALGHTFTNYTPFYGYLLFVATRFDGLAAPLHLIKAISFVFELASALMAARLVSVAVRRPHAPAIAFVAVWLAPTVLFNGAVWGQADAIWTFFVLLSIYLMCRRRWIGGIIAFAVAFAIKAQASFLGPFVLGFVLCRKVHWIWLAAVPAVYVVLAAPALALGEPLSDVLTVYLKQSQFFHRLSMNAANLWVFVPVRFYEAGTVIGLALAAAAGTVLALVFARYKGAERADHVLLAAGLSLLLMPLLLPKMHERYFYAFELTALILACIQPRLILLPLAAQLNGLIAYLAYYGVLRSLFAAAAIGNLFIAAVLGLYAWRKFSQPYMDERHAFSPAVFLVGFCATYGVIGLTAAMR